VKTDDLDGDGDGAAHPHGKRQTPLPACCNNPACLAESRNAGEGGRRASLCAFRAESAQEIRDKAYRQNQANPAAADDGTSKVKPTAAEQEKTNKYD